MKDEISNLVARYFNNRSEYRSGSYNEAETRAEFIDTFFKILGWDVANERNLSRRFREVSREIGVRVGAQEKRPDYEFRLGSERKFFVEAKKPSVDIIASPEPAFQVRRYGWSAGLKISIVTNFEYLVIYDTTTKPLQSHAASHSRLHVFHYLDYPTKCNDIANLLSRDTVFSGLFDEQFSEQTQNRPLESIDKVFLNQLNRWRLRLCEDILSRKPDADENMLNEASQLFILRILFLRMCEDRGITNYEKLKATALTNDWDEFIDLLHEADRRFNSGLFDTNNDPFSKSTRQRIQLDSNTVQYIVDSIYFPEAPYTFSVLEPEFLGSVYEQFLTERITVTDGNVSLTLKPEHVKRDIIATPRPIIERIVQDTIYPTLQQLSASDILTKKAIDPACGSGGFLISAFDVFIDVMTTAHVEAGNHQDVYETSDGWQLTFEQKCKILTNCIYGVDRDYAATEVAKFSLLVKLLENETSASLPSNASILPRLDQNIVCGDSLIDDRIYELSSSPETVGPPLTWGQDIPNKFAYIVGNPPYLKTEDMINLERMEHKFYKKHYVTAYKQFDKYYLFLEKAVKTLLATDGYLGMLVANKFLHIESGKKLRQVLSREAHITRLIDFGNTQLFEGRTTYTCVLYLSPNRSNPIEEDDPVQYQPVSTLKDWINRDHNTQHYIELPRYLISTEDAWLLPATNQELKLLETLYKDSIPLGEIAHVFNGIQTSANDVYVITDWIEADNNTIQFNAKGQNWRIEKDILKLFFDESKGKLISYYPLPRTAYVIFPYFINVGNNRFQATLIPPDIMQSRFPLAYEWLLFNRDRLVNHRDIQPRPFPANEWYRYGRVQGLTSFENRAKIIVGINSLGDKYVYDDTNTLLAPGGTAGECSISAFREAPEKSPYDLYFILALLNHKAIEYFCRKRGSPFRGGWYSRGTSVLGHIPIPKIDLTTDNQKLRLYESITQNCKLLCEVCASVVNATTNAERTQLMRREQYLKQSLNTDISTLYGISDIIDSIELPK